MVRILVNAGADVNARDARKYPMLFHAILKDPEMVRILVNAGADVNAKDDVGISMLNWAIIKDKPEIVGILVDAGAKE